MNEWLSMLILGVVEGLTEFLPISSTGHLILANAWMGLESEKAHATEIIIQAGAILAVVWEYRTRLLSMLLDWRHHRVVRQLFVAFLPVLILGPLLHKSIKNFLFNPMVVALSLFFGGVAIYIAERWMQKSLPNPHQKSSDLTIDSTLKQPLDDLTQMSLKTAFAIGCFQMIAMIPGTSRSAATIIGGLFCGLSRRTATEFSFLLALPTLGGACVYEFYKSYALFIGPTAQNDQSWLLLLFGLVVSFVVALATIRWLLKFIRNHSFIGFAWYRVGLACVVFWFWLA